MHHVADYMSTPAITVRTDDTLKEILQIFDRGVIRAVPVVDRDGSLAGVVSTTDVIRRLAKPLDETLRAADIMSSPVVVATPKEAIDLAAWRLVAARAHRLIVVEDDRPVGVLAVDDALGALLHREVAAPLSSIMSRPVASVLLGASIAEAIARLTNAGVHGLVVLDGLAPVGTFGQTEALSARRLPTLLLEDPVEEVMCDELITLDASTPIQNAARYAWSTKARRILVSEAAQLVGIVSDLDLVDALARTIDKAAAS